MQWWMLPSLLGTGTSLLTAFYAFRFVRQPANLYMTLLALAAAWVCIMQWAALLLPENLEYRLFLAQIQYLGFASGPTFWMLTALAYCDYRRSLAIARVAAWVIPIISLLLVFSNHRHQMIWERFELIPGAPGLDVVYGRWFTVFVFYTYFVVFVGTLIFARRFARSRKYWIQLLAALLAPLAVFGMNFNYLLGLSVLPIDPTPAGIAVAALLITLATRSNLFSVVPVAQQAILDSLEEGVLVTTGSGRIADTNRAAREILGMRETGIGKQLDQWLSTPERSEEDLSLDGGRHIHLRTFPINGGHKDQGQVIVLRDVTEERAAKAHLLKVQNELRALNLALEEMAHTDSLTGLVNRRRLNDALSAEWSRTLRHDTAMAFMLIDLDHFKRINDTYGHLTGDRVLEKVGQTLLELIRNEDLLARYGGEEFALLLPETDAAAAIQVGQRLNKAIAELIFEDKTLGPFAITASIGISCREHSDSSIEALIARADAALYHTKDHGRDGISLASGSSCKRLDSAMPVHDGPVPA